MIKINIGDSVGFLLPNPPSPGDRLGNGPYQSGVTVPTIVKASVIGIGQNDIIDIRIETSVGYIDYFGAVKDETRSTVFSWHTLRDISYQPSLFGRRIITYDPGNGNALGVTTGMVLTPAGTISHPTLVATNKLTSSRRTRFASATTANAVGGVLSAHEICWRGNSAGLGGFFFVARFGIALNPANTRAFIGLSASTTSLVASEPSTVANSIGIGFDAADSAAGSWKFISRDNANGSKIDLPLMQRNTTGFFELRLYSPPNSNIIIAKVININLDTELHNNVIINNLPQNSVFLRMHAAVGPAAAATATQLELAQLYLESDS